MNRIAVVIGVLALPVALTACGSSQSAQPVKTVTVSATPDAARTTSASPTSAPTGAADSAEYPGATDQVHNFGTTFTDSEQMGRFVVSRTTPGDMLTAQDYSDGLTDHAVKRWVSFTVSVTNLTGTVIETDGLSGTATVGQAELTCQMTGQDFGGNILPGRTRTYKIQCGGDKDGRLTYELDSMNLGLLGIFTNEPA